MHVEIKKYHEQSLQSKKGLTFYINGNTVNGYVVRIIDDDKKKICSAVA